jgi:mono/diheme cytochrome c family protein
MARLSTTRATGSTLLVACGLGLSALLFAPQSAQAQTASAPARIRSTMAGVYTADQAVKGKEVFLGTCSGCHTVASHSGELFATRWMGKSLNDFYDYVSRLMPKSAPGTLSEDEYVWVTAYVLKLNGMPASSQELSAEPALLKAIRIDSTKVSAGGRSGGDHLQNARLR